MTKCTFEDELTMNGHVSPLLAKKGTMYHSIVTKDHFLLCNRRQARQLPMRTSREAGQRSEV